MSTESEILIYENLTHLENEIVTLRDSYLVVNPNNPLEITGPHSWPKRCKHGSIAA